MRRRDTLLVLLAHAAMTLPLVALAQQQRTWRVGFLSLARRPASLDKDITGAFPRALLDFGYVEGSNLVIEWRFAGGDPRRVALFAQELVQAGVDVIVTSGAQAISAAHHATHHIPIVMATSADPVGSGFVRTLARPGGNITGLSTVTSELSPKLLDLLLASVPNVSRVAVLVNPSNATHAKLVEELRSAAQKKGVALIVLEAGTTAQVQSSFSRMKEERAGALIVAADQFFVQQRRELAEDALRARMPAVFMSRAHAEAGGLMSYGQDLADNYRRAAVFVDKILKGANPAELPVELPTKFEFVINRQTAKALGITVPPSLLVRADEVIH